jgi:gas vesicle structural protein
MPLEQDGECKSLIDVLDRILDRGIVIDTWVRVSLVGIDFITLEARVVVASIETYLRHAEALGASFQASPPPRRHELRPRLRALRSPRREA